MLPLADHDGASVKALEHERNVRFLLQRWSDTEQLHNKKRMVHDEGGSEYYQEKVPNPNLSSFQPLDLESWITHRKQVKAVAAY